jgi:hypothetical protein
MEVKYHFWLCLMAAGPWCLRDIQLCGQDSQLCLGDSVSLQVIKVYHQGSERAIFVLAILVPLLSTQLLSESVFIDSFTLPRMKAVLVIIPRKNVSTKISKRMKILHFVIPVIG